MRKFLAAMALVLAATSAHAITFTEDTSFVGPNPERGPYSKNTSPSNFINSGGDIGSTASTAYSGRTYPSNVGSKSGDTSVLYDRFEWPLDSNGKARVLSSTEKGNLQSNLAALRGTGTGVVLRPRFKSFTQSMSDVRKMIDDFGAAVASYCDVIIAVEVGFVGNFGEWHDQQDPGTPDGNTSCQTQEDCVCEADGSTYFPRDGPTDICRSSWSAGNCECYSSCQNGFCNNTTANTVSCSTDTDCIGADTQSVYDYAMAKICPSGNDQRMVCFRNPRWRMIPKYQTAATSVTAYNGSTNSRMCFYDDGWFTGRYDGSGTLNCREYNGQGGGGNSNDYVNDMTAYTFSTGESSQFLDGTRSDTTSCGPAYNQTCTMCETGSAGWNCQPADNTGNTGHGTCIDYRAPAQAIPHAAEFHMSMWNDGFTVNGGGINWDSDSASTARGGYTASAETAYVLNQGTYGGENGLTKFLKKMGYRYVLTAATLPASCSSGGSCAVSFTLRNDGFARLFNKRTAYVTLDNGTASDRRNIPLAVDFRKAFAPGGASNGTPVTITETITVPSGMGNGAYTVALWLPSISSKLRYTGNGGSRPTQAEETKHNLRFANTGTWSSTKGYNTLGTITIGSVDECNSASDCPDDTNVCTTRTCFNPTSTSSTCGFTNNTAACDDTQFCNGADVCFGGTCSAHAGSPCTNPGFPVCNETTDICETDVSGCTTAADCNDGNGCTTDTCLGGTSWPVFNGRIAISSDGNKHDCDDLFGTAVAVGLIAKSGNAPNLVYYGHSDHHWDSAGSCTSYSGAARETRQNELTHDYAEDWNAQLSQDFDLDVFLNCTQDYNGTGCGTACQACVDALAAEINVSTSSNRLYILEAGPADIIGRAMAQATTGRQYVTIISHNTGFNDIHSDNPFAPGENPNHSGWTFAEIQAAVPQATYKHITNQNSSGGLKTAHSNFWPWRDSSDPLLNTLWQANLDTGKPDADCSDAGMTYWLLKGQDNLDQLTSPQELLDAFAESGGCSNTPNSASCTDGLYCNGPDTCGNSSCSVHAGNPCGTGTCQEATDTCAVDECNLDADCADLNICTTETCLDPASGSSTCLISNNSSACDDGLFCNGADLCVGGGCTQHTGSPCALGQSCNESTNVCVTDECNTAADCREKPTDNTCTTDTCLNASASNSTCQRVNNTIACDDTVFCNGTDSCQSGSCQVHAGNPCPTNFDCDETLEVCTGECTTNADCVEVPDEPCTTDTCVAAACVRVNNTDSCSDSLRCNGADTCGAGTCSSHTGDPCSVGYTCIEEYDASNVCHLDDAPWIDQTNVKSACISTSQNPTVMSVTLDDNAEQSLLVFIAAESVEGGCNLATLVTGEPVVTLGTLPMSMERYTVTGGVALEGLCLGIWSLDNPPEGTYDLSILWNDVLPTVIVAAVPVYNLNGRGWFEPATIAGGANAVFPRTRSVSPVENNTLTFGLIAADKQGVHADEGEGNITDPTQLLTESCGAPGLSMAVQFNEAATTASVDWDFLLDAGSSTYMTMFQSQFTATTTSTTTTTLPTGPGGGRFKAVCKCKVK